MVGSIVRSTSVSGLVSKGIPKRVAVRCVKQKRSAGRKWAYAYRVGGSRSASCFSPTRDVRKHSRRRTRHSRGHVAKNRHTQDSYGNTRAY